jgi:hypothetical protein
LPSLTRRDELRIRGPALKSRATVTPTLRVESAQAIQAAEQIARAVELGLGVTHPDQIELVTSDSDSADFAKRIRAILN